jgi:methionyl-tRNA formyltransferase
VSWIDNVNDKKNIRRWGEESPDIIISAAYPQIFGEEVLNVPSVDALNFHPSALPKYRGAHPHFWVIYNGESQTGVTAHQMTTEIDAGKIVAQRVFPCAQLTYEELYDRIVDETSFLINEVEEFFVDGEGDYVEQKEEKVTEYKNNRKIHGKIQWSLNSAEEIKNVTRTGKSFFFLGRKKIIISRAEAKNKNRNVRNKLKVESGTIVDIKKEGLVVKAKSNFLSINSVTLEGVKISGFNLAQKININIGEKLT